MKRKEQSNLELRKTQYNENNNSQLLKKQTIKELIAPSGINASNIDHLEIISNVSAFTIYKVLFEV